MALDRSQGAASAGFSRRGGEEPTLMVTTATPLMGNTDLIETVELVGVVERRGFDKFRGAHGCFGPAQWRG